MLLEDDEGYYLPPLGGCLGGSLSRLYEMIKIPKPSNLTDLAKLLCLDHGKFESWGYLLNRLKERGLEGVISNREELYCLLTEFYDLDKGIAAYLCRLGLLKGLSEMDRLSLESQQVSEDVIGYLENTRYLYPLAHMLAVLTFVYANAYLKLHYGVKPERLWVSSKKEGYVGPFFYIAGKLYSQKQRAKSFDSDRRYFDVGLSHFLFFDQLGFEGDYGQYPRGRVIFDNLDRKFLIYLDKSLRKNEIKKIIEEFSLEEVEKESIRFLLDEHYEHDGL